MTAIRPPNWQEDTSEAVLFGILLLWFTALAFLIVLVLQKLFQ